jgi:hypothetical protein
MRVTVQSQANRSTAFEEIGSENSISAAGAPARPSSLQRSRHLQMGALARPAVVELMHGNIDQRIGQPPLAVAMVVLAISLRQRLECCAQSTASDLVEDRLDQDAAVVGSAEGEASRLHPLPLLVDDTLRVGGMAGVSAGVVKLDHALLARVAQKPGFVEFLTTRD